MTSTLRFTSIQAPNADPFCRALCAYLGSVLSIPTQYVNTSSWQAREAALDSGNIQVGWICGLPYTWKADRQPPQAALLAAPVMAGSRYLGKPVYFSDVVVRRESSYQSFLDLRGKTWAYNEPHSHSGFNITRFKLASIGAPRSYFSRVVAAGSHQRALELVLSGMVDASAIDSTVLETELAQDPGLHHRIRIIEILGPSPIPPWVVTPGMPEELRSRLQHALLEMHLNPNGRQILATGRTARFVLVNDRDYEPIRRMERLAEDVEF